MDIPNITWRGESIEDVELLQDLPQELVALLSEVNGFIIHSGALHVRGACLTPEWHSIRSAWRGPESFHKLYDKVESTDIPFAQDQVGDQFLLRNGAIHRLSAETGVIEPFSKSLQAFLKGLHGNIEEFRNVGLNHDLQPGQLLHAYPPFCFKESGKDASLKASPAREVIVFHAKLARQIRDLPEGGQIKFEVTD